jgi:hypothetical protein
MQAIYRAVKTQFSGLVLDLTVHHHINNIPALEPVK